MVVVWIAAAAPADAGEHPSEYEDDFWDVRGRPAVTRVAAGR
ncbi:hypothetical protein ABT075_22755 [Streptomyces sp. NPDC002677]